MIALNLLASSVDISTPESIINICMDEPIVYRKKNSLSMDKQSRDYENFSSYNLDVQLAPPTKKYSRVLSRVCLLSVLLLFYNFHFQLP